MARSGYTDAYVTAYDTLRFSWSQDSQSIENNTTTIKWYLYLISGSYGAINSSPLKGGAVYINDGGNITHSVSVGIGNNITKTLASGTKTITHNSDGTKTFSYSFYQNFDITFSGTYIGTVSGSGSGTLEPIARHATLTKATDFTDEGNPTITFSNPAGTSITSLQAAIAFESCPGWKVVPYREITNKTSGTYTFSLSDTERDSMRGALKGSKEFIMIFFLSSTIGNDTKVTTQKAKITIVPDYPTITPIVKDYGRKSYALTNNRDVIIKGLNRPKVKFNAVAKKEAWIKSQTVKCLNRTYTPVSDDADGFDGYFENVESATFEFSVTDSRGFTTTQTVTKTFINYVKPTLSLSSTSSLNSSTNKAVIILKAEGKAFYANLGAILNEPGITYRFKKNDGEYTDWKDAEIYDNFIDSESYSKNIILMTEEIYGDSGTVITPSFPMEFDFEDVVTVQMIIYDEIHHITYHPNTKEPKEGAILVETKIAIQPVFDWSKSDFAFHVPVTTPSLSVNNISLGGGELIGYGIIHNNTWTSDLSLQTGVLKAWSDLNGSSTSSKNSYELYVDDSILTFNDGTFLVYPKNIVGVIDVEVVLSGYSDSHCYGMWWKGNSNELLSGVSILGFGSSDNTLGALTYLPQGKFCSSSHKYIYSVDRSKTFSSTDCFYINPTFEPYGYGDSTTGYFRPNDGGTKSYMIIKIYSKRGV